MQNKNKKLVSSLLALIMLLGLFTAMPLTASAADVVVPAPTNLDVTVGTNNLIVTWDYGITRSLISFDISRKEEYLGSWNDTFATVTGVTTYTDDTAAEGVRYYYRVRASMITSAITLTRTYSNWSTEGYKDWFLTLEAPGNLTATAGPNGITLNWTDNSPGISTDFLIEQQVNTETPRYFITTDTTYTDDTAEAGITYTYKVRARRDAGHGTTNGPPSNGVTVKMEAAPAFVAVTDITGVPATASVGTPLTLTGTVAPADATNKVIAWSVSNAGTTGATINGNVFNATAAGTATITATVANGATATTPFTKNFTITVTAGFVAVTDITGVPATASVGTPLTLTGTVAPADATNKTIAWSLSNAGTTGATINGNVFNASAAGTATITATITNGATATTPFTKNFTITVTVKEADEPGEDDRIGKPFPFTDVPGNAWYYGDVKTAWETRLIDGVTDTLFKPKDNLTYAQAVKLAACMQQLYTTGSVTLANGSPAWYQSYVDYAKANGIISKDYNWGGSAYATRAGYMEIFANALPPEALAEKNTINDGAIPDVPMSHPQAAAIYKLYRAGILEGVDGAHNCNPGANITRDEVSAILTRMMNPEKRKGFSM